MYLMSKYSPCPLLQTTFILHAYHCYCWYNLLFFTWHILGWYTDTTGQDTCTECSAGFYCTSTTQSSCTNGYYSLSASSSCTQCPAGYECSSASNLPVICTPGYYSLVGSTVCTPCEAGYYCPSNGTEIQTPCAEGT